MQVSKLFTVAPPLPPWAPMHISKLVTVFALPPPGNLCQLPKLSPYSDLSSYVRMQMSKLVTVDPHSSRYGHRSPTPSPRAPMQTSKVGLRCRTPSSWVPMPIPKSVPGFQCKFRSWSLYSDPSSRVPIQNSKLGAVFRHLLLGIYASFDIDHRMPTPPPGYL